MHKKNWQIRECTLLQSADKASEINTKGWSKLNGISLDELNNLETLFLENHRINDYGMFYSLYSEDLEYRKRINDGIIDSLKPSLERNFKDFKIIYGVFVVKTPGNEDTEFFLHQDPSYTDEFKYSSLHFWVPLDDVSKKNGALSVVEGSQNISHPYRSITIPAVFSGNEKTMRPYLKPISVKKGEAIALDPRLIHNSLANKSNQNRVVALIGMIPKEAPIVLTYKDEDGPKNRLELFEFEDDHFLTGKNFFMSCKCRPEEGKLIDVVEYDSTPMNKEELIERMLSEEIIRIDELDDIEEMVECKMFGEPSS